MNKSLLFTALAAASLGAALLVPQAARAADGTVTITGKVLNGTCTVATNGGSNVVLNNVQASALTKGAAYTASAKGFTVALTNCPTSPSGLAVGLVFQTTNADTTTGTLNNTGVTGMDVQLMYTASGNGTAVTPAITGGTAVSLDGTTVTGPVTLTGASAYYNFYAMYYPTSAWAVGNTGAVSTSAQFNVNYQ